jgi:phage regulator Rha-like protein
MFIKFTETTVYFMQNQVTSIIEEIDGQLVVSHRIIAVQTNNKVLSVQKLITENIEELEEFGLLRFKIEAIKNAKNRINEEKTYYLNEQQATLLLTFMRNNTVVKQFKIRLVKDFFKMREALKSQKVPVQKSEFLVKVEERTQLIEEAGKQFKVFKEVFQDIGITEQKELAITTNRAVKNETTVDFIALSGKNGLEVEEKYHTVTELCELIRESEDFSDEIKLSISTKDNSKPQPRNLNKILESHGFQIKIDKQWKPTKKGENFSKFVQNKSLNSTKNIFHLNWKLEVLEEIF